MKPSAMSNYALPAGVGALEGAAAANLPLASDAYLVSPALNPEREAYRAYARELPPDHPRRQEWMDYAERLPAENPVRAAAAKELYDPQKLAERSGIGLVEGAIGGYMGAKVPQLFGRMYEGAKSVAGRFLRDPANSPTTVATDAGTLPAANRLSQPSTSGAMSNEPMPPGSAIERNALAGDAVRSRRVKVDCLLPQRLPIDRHGHLIHLRASRSTRATTGTRASASSGTRRAALALP